MIDISLNSWIYQSHIISGTITFFIGPLQFLHVIRQKSPHFHSLLGRTYVLCVIISSCTGLMISFNTPLIWAIAGTSLQSLLWLAVTLNAVHHIRHKRIKAHQHNMLRSYALVLAAPFVRLEVALLEWIGLDYQNHFEFYYPLFIWLSFLPLIFIEIYNRCNRYQTP